MLLNNSTNDITRYDYIITGAGCAGLSLLMYMIHSGHFHDKKILLVDKDLKKANDRTWCFWEKDAGLFEPVVYRRWDRLWFSSPSYRNVLQIEPYQYKMIRGLDFYAYCFEEIQRHQNISVRFEQVDNVFSSENETGISIGGKKILCKYIFNSILFEKPRLDSKDYWLLQHFKGWTIEAEENCFDAGVATFMDFSTEQNEKTAFCYVLPFSSKVALIEYTVFSIDLLQQAEYTSKLNEYIKNSLGIGSYKILEEEFGIIPMTNHRFASAQNNIVNIGMAGGQTKGSSGYTFNFIQKHSHSLVQELMRTGKPFLQKQPRRFRFYDSVLLKILHDKTVHGEAIFSDLFRKNDPKKILQFLDNETSIRDEIDIISSLPILPFTRAAVTRIF